MCRLFRQLRSLTLLTGLALASVAYAQPAPKSGFAPQPGDRYEPVPEDFRRNTAGVGITEHLGAQIPLNLKFVDTSNRHVTLGEYFNKGRPLIIQLGYFRCPQICDVVSHGVMKVAQDLDLEMGKDYDVLYVSINPEDTWQLAQEKKRNYVQEYTTKSGRGGAIEGWNFLVGTEPHIRALAEAIGFNYRPVEGKSEFSHPTMVAVLTPDGRVSQYLYGNEFSKAAMRLALVEASNGKIGNLTDQIVLLCYHYDSYSGKYTLQWMRLMRAGGILTVLILGYFLGRRWIKDFKAERAAARAAAGGV